MAVMTMCGSVSIGRDHANTITLEDASISRSHARIDFDS